MKERTTKKVVILGGGIAGMSAAHELIERGFAVEVLECKGIAGGKARSLPATGVSLGGPFDGSRAVETAVPLPGEHGFRFFPGFYRHVVHTMQRIPYRGRSVADNLVDAREVSLAAFDRGPIELPARFPLNGPDLQLAVVAAIAALCGQLGVPLSDGQFFASKIWQFMSSCEERRNIEYERTSWWEFIEADARSEAYRTYFAHGITRSLVAAQARRASAKTIGDIFLQLMFDIGMPSARSADRLLNGPTNDVWIDPWLEYLQARGVVYRRNAKVTALHTAAGHVQRVQVSEAGSSRAVSGDYFIAALPVERMIELLDPELLALDRSLGNLHELSRCVEWMNGIQFFLTEALPLAAGHVVYVDSPWALTSVSQKQFWKDFDLGRYGDGRVRDILSVDISDWNTKGLNGKEARHCTRLEIAVETWQQLKRSLNGSRELLHDAQLHSWFLDPDIEDLLAASDPAPLRQNTNLEPLLVNYVDTWRLRPEAVTRVRNLFLASDYVRTFTDLATMEAANEAARRAVNGVLNAARSSAPACEIWNLHEPELLWPFKAYDRARYRLGLAWDGVAASALSAVATLGLDEVERLRALTRLST